MLITLTGNNGFGLQAELDRLVTEFVAEHGDIALERLDGEEADYDRMREALQSMPFLASRKLVMLRAAGANKTFAEKAEHLLADLPETTDVILVEPKLDKRSAYYKLLKKITEYQEYNELDGFGLSKWLTQQATGLGGKLSSSDAKYLVERVGANQQMLGNELNKLVAYDPNVSRESIDLLTDLAPQSTIFQLLDAAFAGNRKRMLQLYTEQRAARVEPQQIIAMLAWQLHIMAVVKTAGERDDSEIAKDAKISPYVVSKTRGITSKLTLSKLKQLIDHLTDLDRRLKTIGIDADDAVQAYLLGI